MSFQQKLKHEVEALPVTMLYFGTWIGTLVCLKELTLAEYHIKFHGLTLAIVGVLVIAKVVLVLEHVPLGKWTQNHPVALEVLLRTALYAVGVFVVLLLEKAFESRHEHGGMFPALARVFEHPDFPHVLANSIWLAGALLGFNALSVVRAHLGKRGLIRLFLSPPHEKDLSLGEGMETLVDKAQESERAAKRSPTS